MLSRLYVRGFKSLVDVTLELPRLTVLFGSNAAGKSNVLEAVQALSHLGTMQTLSDALAESIRGYPIEAFSFSSGGLSELLAAPEARFSLEADLVVEKETYRYRVEVQVEPAAGLLRTVDEYLALLSRKGDPEGTPAIERVGDHLHIRRRGKPGRPRQEPIGLNHTTLSDPRLGGVEYRWLERVRAELSDWRTYDLDPRVAMRAPQPPADVRDIGARGDTLAPFLARLRAEHPKNFEAVVRTLCSIVPSVEELSVDLDNRRGTLDILLRQEGVEYPSRLVSEGTLRVLALCAVAANPWGGSLLTFEEPENGVHPRRLELIAQLLLSLALEHGRQIIVTTHSPLFCDTVLKASRTKPGDVGLFNVRREGAATVVQPFDASGPLLENREIAEALTAGTEDRLFESLLRRGMLDE